MKSRGIWIATTLVLLGGAFLLFSLNRPDRQRQAVLGEVGLGDPAEGISERLALTPTVCPPGPLDHLQGSFPEGWPPASVDVALERLEALTAERWVYPVRGAVAECGGGSPRTEIGVAADGSVAWSIAVVGRTVLNVPPTITPAGTDSVASP